MSVGNIHCAQFSQKTALNAPGRLTKMEHHNRVSLEKDEENRIRHILQTTQRDLADRNEKKFPLPEVVSEESLYTEVILSSQARDLDKMDFFSKQLISKFPQSVFCDNALNLKGQLELALGVPSLALRDFEKIINVFPLSNKVPTALFGKAVAYRKLQLFNYAEDVLKEIKQNYPGSPEFFRVELEEKLLKLEKGI